MLLTYRKSVFFRDEGVEQLVTDPSTKDVRKDYIHTTSRYSHLKGSTDLHAETRVFSWADPAWCLCTHLVRHGNIGKPPRPTLFCLNIAYLSITMWSYASTDKMSGKQSNQAEELTVKLQALSELNV